MIYQWKNGGRGGVSAQVAGERIERIRAAHGTVRPIDVVDDARPEDSPLHGCFEWDDAKAAEKWRVDQARDLLGALVIVPAETPDAEPVRAFIAIGPGNLPNDYTPLHVVMDDEELRAQALARALNEFRDMRARYAQLRELAKVWDAVEEVQGAVA